MGNPAAAAAAAAAQSKKGMNPDAEPFVPKNSQQGGYTYGRTRSKDKKRRRRGKKSRRKGRH
jgi:hypothetical protein